MRQIARTCAEYLVGRKLVTAFSGSRKLSDNTIVTVTDRERIIYLHSTAIMTYHKDCGMLCVSMGGWDTRTTRSRINDMFYCLYEMGYLPRLVGISCERCKRYITIDTDKLCLLQNTAHVFRVGPVSFSGDTPKVDPELALGYVTSTIAVQHKFSCHVLYCMSQTEKDLIAERWRAKQEKAEARARKRAERHQLSFNKMSGVF